jgi:hypothetical protein
MSTSSIRKLTISLLLTETSADLFECASNFTMHLLETGFGAFLIGDESHFYRPVQYSSDLPDYFPVATLDLIALDR